MTKRCNWRSLAPRTRELAIPYRHLVSFTLLCQGLCEETILRAARAFAICPRCLAATSARAGFCRLLYCQGDHDPFGWDLLIRDCLAPCPPMHVESEQMLRFAAMMRRGSPLELGLNTEDCICGGYRTGRAQCRYGRAPVEQ